MKRITVKVDEKDYRPAKAFCKATGRKINFVIGQALREYLAKQQDQSKGQAA